MNRTPLLSIGLLLPAVLSLLAISACTDSPTGISPTVSEQDTGTPESNKQTFNIENGTSLVEQCDKCHNNKSIADNQQIPYIAGQQYQYILDALQAYKTSNRPNKEMQEAVAQLTEPEIIYLANYYSTKTLAWPILDLPKETTIQEPTKQLIQLGKSNASACFSCHGDTGNSTKPGVPSLAGLDNKYIEIALRGYFSGERKNEFMKVFKHAIDQEKITALAAYFSSLTRLNSTMTGKGDAHKGKQLANQYCVGCHGNEGNSYIEEFPSLSGQNFKFLVSAINSYNNGQRNNQLMKDAIKGIKDADIKNLATYYAKQKPEPTTPVGTHKGITSGNDPMLAAQNSARACFGCHGENGTSSISGYPNLSGLTPEYIQSTIQFYKNGTRSHASMKFFVDKLSDMELELVSLYFANQSPVEKDKMNSKQEKNKATDKVLEEKIAACNGCHGENGNSTGSAPSIAGQNQQYLTMSLHLYKNKKREDENMQKATADLNKTEIKALAAHYAMQHAVKPEIQLPSNPEKLVEKCWRCHKPVDGKPVTGPFIVSQPYPYLKSTLYQYKRKQRDHSMMFAMTDVLTHWEIDKLARYFSQQTPN